VCNFPPLPVSTVFSLPDRRTQLLKFALPLVKHHGFTRTALACSVLDLPEPHIEPLSDSAVTTLFGEGDTARRSLINAWLDEGRAHMRSVPVDGIKGALLARLEYNVPVLGHLPEVSRIGHEPHNECSQVHLGIRTCCISETRHSAS
jgi:ubiquinone biosynthesis protein COQ9